MSTGSEEMIESGALQHAHAHPPESQEAAALAADVAELRRDMSELKAMVAAIAASTAATAHHQQQNLRSSAAASEAAAADGPPIQQTSTGVFHRRPTAAALETTPPGFKVTLDPPDSSKATSHIGGTSYGPSPAVIGPAAAGGLSRVDSGVALDACGDAGDGGGGGGAAPTLGELGMSSSMAFGRHQSMRFPTRSHNDSASSAARIAAATGARRMTTKAALPTASAAAQGGGGPTGAAPRKWNAVLEKLREQKRLADLTIDTAAAAAAAMRSTGPSPAAAGAEPSAPMLGPQTTTVDFLADTPFGRFEASDDDAAEDSDGSQDSLAIDTGDLGLEHPRARDYPGSPTARTPGNAFLSVRSRAPADSRSPSGAAPDGGRRSTLGMPRNTSSVFERSGSPRRTGNINRTPLDTETPLLASQSPTSGGGGGANDSGPTRHSMRSKATHKSMGAAPSGSVLTVSACHRDQMLEVTPEFMGPWLDSLQPHVLPTRAWQSNVCDAAYVLSAVLVSAIATMPVHLYRTHDAKEGDPVPGMPVAGFEAAVFLSMIAQVVTMIWTGVRLIEPRRLLEDPWQVARAPRAIWNSYTRPGRNLAIACFDAFMAVPIEWVFFHWNWDLFFAFHLRHFARVIRFATFGVGNDPLSPTRSYMRLFCTFVVILLLIHCLSCGFWSIEPDMTYEAAVYWTVTTLSTVGYGDIVPSPKTRPYACVTMVVSMGTVSFLTAYVTMVLTKRDLRREREEDAKSHMDAMLQYYGLPDVDRRRVTTYFPSLLEHDHEEQFRQLVAGLPAKERERIVAFVHAKALRAIDIFAGLPSDDLIVLCRCLERKLYAAGAEIFAQGDPGNAMFFLIRGAAEIVRIHPKALEPVRIPCPRVFGEMALLENCTRSAWVVATSPCELLVLSRENFDASIRHHAPVFRVIVGIAERRKADNRRQATAQAAKFIREESLFQRLSGDACATAVLATHLEPEIAEAGAQVIVQGRCSDAMYFIVTGTAEAVRFVRGEGDDGGDHHGAADPESPQHVTTAHSEVEGGGGHEVSLAMFRRGDIFGEMEVLTNETSRASVRAVTRLELLRLTREHFDLIRKEHSSVETLMRFLSDIRAGRLATDEVMPGDDITETWTEARLRGHAALPPDDVTRTWTDAGSGAAAGADGTGTASVVTSSRAVTIAMDPS